MINIGKEWRWMDDIEDNVQKIEDDKWDFYSGLPNPKWYERNEEDK